MKKCKSGWAEKRINAWFKMILKNKFIRLINNKIYVGMVKTRFFFKLELLPLGLMVINLWTKLVKWFLVNFGFWLIRSQPDWKEWLRQVIFIISFDAAKQVKGFLKNSNSSYYFPLPLHSKKTAGNFRQSSFKETGIWNYFFIPLRIRNASERLSVIGTKE